MRRLLGCLLIAALAVPLGAGVPRKSPEFVVDTPNGEIRVSELSGKVVALEFLLTTCPHCKETSTVMEKVFRDLSGKGFEAIGVAVNDDARELVSGYIQELGLSFPVGAGDRGEAAKYLEHPPMLLLQFPQLVFIDKKGTIRAQYRGTDSFIRWNEEQNIRNLVEKLLAE